MADMIRVNTELLDRCANELKQAARGFDDAASILAGLNTGEEWWTKMGRFQALTLQDEGGSVQLGDAGAAVRSLTATMRRYNGRMTRLGDSTARVASMFDNLEHDLSGKAGNQGGADWMEMTDIIFTGADVDRPKSPSAGNARTEADERKKREERAKWIKFGVGALAFVGSMAVVIATGGAALPVIVAGATAGAVTAGVNNAADQYAEKGWDNINWGDAGRDAVIGGIVGGTTSAISIAGGTAAQQVTSRFASYATTTTGKIVTHVAGGTISSIAAGTASRAGGEATRQFLKNGEVDWNSVKESAFDPGQMAVDGVMGGTAGYFRGRRYTDNGQYVRKESYLNKDGDVDWSKAPNGGVDTTKPVTYDYEIPEGTELRRSGSEYGGYLRNGSDSYRSASLPYEYNPALEHRYKVVKPIPGVTKSTAAPAFDMPGGATQYQLPDGVNVADLIKKGYLKRVY